MQVVHPNLRIVQGNVVSYPMVRDALQGNDAVISALGASSPFRYDSSVVSGMFNIVKAMEQMKVMRLIYMSAINVGASRRFAGPLIRILATTLLRTETAGHEARESIIQQSSLAWTIVRAGGLTNGDGVQTGKYRSGADVRARGIIGRISRADVADFMIKELEENAHLREGVAVMY
jgi:putative NADH-flavin reductase